MKPRAIHIVKTVMPWKLSFPAHWQRMKTTATQTAATQHSRILSVHRLKLQPIHIQQNAM